MRRPSIGPFHGAYVVEQAAHHRGAARVGQELALIADEAARRRVEDDPHLAAAGGTHVLHLGLALRQFVDHHAGIFLVEVDLHFLDRLQALAGDRIGLEQHARARDRHLETLAPHLLDQHAELQLAAARDLDRILVLRFGDADRDIALGLALQALDDHARRDLGALAPGQRRIVDRERHRQGRRIDRNGVQRLGQIDRADRVGDGGRGQAGDGDDVARLRFLDRPAVEAAEREQLGEARVLDHACRRGCSDLTGMFMRATPLSMRPVSTRPR